MLPLEVSAQAQSRTPGDIAGVSLPGVTGPGSIPEADVAIWTSPTRGQQRTVSQTGAFGRKPLNSRDQDKPRIGFL